MGSHEKRDSAGKRGELAHSPMRISRGKTLISASTLLTCAYPACPCPLFALVPSVPELEGSSSRQRRRTSAS